MKLSCAHTFKKSEYASDSCLESVLPLMALFHGGLSGPTLILAPPPSPPPVSSRKDEKPLKTQVRLTQLRDWTGPTYQLNSSRSQQKKELMVSPFMEAY